MVDLIQLIQRAVWQPSSNTRVFWEWSRGEGTPTIAFTGTPFMFIGTKEMGCHLGRDISESKKRKEKPDVLTVSDAVLCRLVHGPSSSKVYYWLL